MLRNRILLVCVFLLPGLVADAGQEKAGPQDRYGDPLPAGALARLGTIRFRHDSAIVFAAFLPNGKSVLSVSDNGDIRAWEFPSGKEIRRVNASAMVTSATLSPDGKHLTVFCSDGYLRVVDWAGGKVLGKVAHSTGNVSSALASPFTSSALARSLARSRAASAPVPVYSPDAKTLMLPASARVLQFVDLPNGKEIGPNLGHTEPVTAVAFSLDGKQIRTQNSKSTHVWNAAIGQDLGSASIKLPQTQGTPTIISPDGKIGVTVARFQTPAAANAAKSRKAVLFDTASGKELGTLDLEVEIAPIHRKPILFSPDGKLVAVNGGVDKELIELHEVPSGKLLRTLEGGPLFRAVKGFGPGGGGGFAAGPGGRSRLSGAQKMLFSPDGKVIAFQAGAGASILVLDTVTGKQLASLEGKNTLQGTFTADGRCLALEKTDGTVTLYELATGQPRFTYGSDWNALADGTEDGLADFLFGPGVTLRSKAKAAVSPDGKLLALSGPGGSVQIWDIWSAKELKVFKGHTMTVNALAFAANGKTLATASDDTTALLWDVTKVNRPGLLPKALKAGDLESWWQAIGDHDSGKAFAAMVAFAAVREETVAWIKERVKPAPPLDMKHITQLMQQLDDDQFKVRERATTELLKIGELLLPVLDKAMGGNHGPESRRRLEELRKKLNAVGLQGDRLRSYRAVEILEFIGTPEARQLLQALGAGAPDALITTSAQAALKR